MLDFQINEYQDRVRKVKERMVKEGLDVIVVADPANMCYLSGYNAWSFYVSQALVVALDLDEPFWFGRGQDALVGAKVTTWMAEENIIAYTDDYVHSTVKHPMDYLAEVLKNKGAASKTIGVEMDAYYFSARAYECLKNGLPNAKIADASNLVNWVRIIKSDKELEYMKRAAVILESAMQVAVDSINIGVRECDAAARISSAQIAGTEEFGGDYPSIVPLLPSGDKTGAPHLTWTDNRYKDGDTVIIEIAGCYKRYHCPMSRTLTLGKTNQKVIETAEIVVEGLNAALDVAKPGVTCEEVEAAWSKELKKHGLSKESRIGYSTGVNYPPDWGEHTASLRPNDKTVLQPNMTFHCIPGMWFDDFGIEISECFQVTETGSKPLATYPRKLFLK
jgi:Xaa-Pro dipeptidase